MIPGTTKREPTVAPITKHRVLRLGRETRERKNATVEEQTWKRVFEQPKELVEVAARFDRRATQKLIHTERDHRGIRRFGHDTLRDRDEHLKASRRKHRERTSWRRLFLRRKDSERPATEEQHGSSEEATLQKRPTVHGA